MLPSPSPPPQASSAATTKEPYVLLEETGAGYIAQPSGHEVFYDEAAGLLHIVEGRMVSAVALPGRNLNSNTPAAAATTPANALSSTPSLLASISTPGSQQDIISAIPSPQQQENEEENEENQVFYSTPSSSLHRRTVSDAASIASTTTPSRAFLVSSGPPITAVRASLDGNFTALQRSKLQIEFLDHSTGNMFIETPQNRGAGVILHGFFWTDAVGAEFVLVTSMGLELYSPTIGVQGLKYTAFQRLSSVQWFLWSHSTRILTAGCGHSGAKLQAFQFSRHSGVVRLPMLDLTPPWGSPMKSSPIKKSQGSSTSQSNAVRAVPWLLVSPSQVWILLLYRRVFIAYHDLASSTLKLYRLYRDATSLFAECPLPSISGSGGGGGGAGLYRGGVIEEQIQLSVVDDVLVVLFVQLQQQHADSGTSSGGGTALLIDIAGEGVIGATGVRIIYPVVSTPTQLGVVLLQEGTIYEEENENQRELEGGSEINFQQQQQQQQKLSLFYPHFALDRNSGRIFRLQIDLLALSEACFTSPPSSSTSSAANTNSEIPSLLAFLHRQQERSHRSISTDPRRDPRHVILRVIRRMVNERATPAALRAAFDAVLAPTASSLKRQQQHKGLRKKDTRSNEEEDDEYRSIDAKEIALGILAPALQLPAATSTTTATAAASYVLAALSELFSSCYAAGNYPLHADVASLYLTAYSYAGKEYLLSRLLESHAQLLDSTELAERLAAGEILLACHNHSSRGGGGGSSSKTNISSEQLLSRLASDMWKRLENHTHACKFMLKQGHVLAAIKHAQLFVGVGDSVESDLEDPENIFHAAYDMLNHSTRIDTEEENSKVLKIALKRFLEDRRRKISQHRPSSRQGQQQASSSFLSQDLFDRPTDFLDQQTASLVEALENF
jgi:hypothetical protein